MNLINVNQRIELSVDEEGTEYKNLSSRIEEVTDQYIFISVPMMRGEILPLRIGLRVIVNFVKDGRSFVFRSRIVERKTTPLPLLCLAKPDKIDEIQRRMWVRVAVSIPVDFAIIDASGKTLLEGLGSTFDISGGGILLITDVRLEPQQILKLQINLPNREPVYCCAKVLRINQEELKKEKYKVVLEYNEISENQRDRIMNFIFEKQREWIRKGLL